jgi:ABC-type nitrate/sulfonate/bicarbonate transport system substrate-binding protein
VAAQELGIFASHGLQVRLCREPGWATTRDKLLQHEIDAAIGPASFLYALYRGIGLVRQPCLTALLLPRGGCAITLASALRHQGLSHPSVLPDLIRTGRLSRRLTFGVAPAPGPEGDFLERWLRGWGLDPSRDVRRVSLPPGLVLEHLRRRLIDGFCQAEPWNVAAETAGLGETVASLHAGPRHDQCDPGSASAFDRALLVLRDFTENRPEDHVRLVAALIEGTRYCRHPDNRNALAQFLALPRYCGLDAPTLELALARLAHGSTPTPSSAMAPSTSNGRRILDGPGAPPVPGRTPVELIRRVFRNDLFEQALARIPGACTPPGTRSHDSQCVEGSAPGGAGTSPSTPDPGRLLCGLASAITTAAVSPLPAC